jgi:hypothetical protein
MVRFLLALASTALGLVVSWTLYAYVVGSIGPVELLEVLLLTAPIAISIYRGARALLLTPRPAGRPAPRTAGSAPRSR